LRLGGVFAVRQRAASMSWSAFILSLVSRGCIGVARRLRSGPGSRPGRRPAIRGIPARPVDRFIQRALLGGLLAMAAMPTIRAQTFSSEPAGVLLTFTPSVVSEYLFRGVRLGGPSFQPAIEAARGNFALGLWTSFPLADKVPGVSDPELDVYGAYTMALGDRLSVMPGFTWYNTPRADRSAGRHVSTFEPSVALNVIVAGVRLTPKLYYDTVREGPTTELSAACALPLKRLGTELDIAAAVGTYRWRRATETPEGRIENGGDYWQCGVSVPYALTRNSRLTAGLAYAQGRNNYTKSAAAPKRTNPAAVGRVAITISYAINF
jgi:hypothetical protein